MNQSFKQRVYEPVAVISATHRRDLLQAILQFFDTHRWELVEFNQRVVDDTFYARVAWRDGLEWMPLADVDSYFAPLRERFSATINVRCARSPFSVGIVVDQSERLLSEVLDGFAKRDTEQINPLFVAGLDVELERVAARFGVPFYLLEGDVATEAEATLQDVTQRHNVDSLGFASSKIVTSGRFLRSISATAFGVQSGFISAASGAPQIKFDAHWAEKAGARIIAGSSYMLSEGIGSEVVIDQATRRLQAVENTLLIQQKRRKLEAKLFLSSLTALRENRLVQASQRCLML